MARMEQVLRQEIARLARKEIRGVCGPLRSEVVALRRTVSRLSKTMVKIERIARQQKRRLQEDMAQLKPPPEDLEKSRMSAGLIKKLRTRLGLTQAQIAGLIGVSTPAVVFWESGRSSPRGANRAALVALRKYGKREVRQLLEEKGLNTKRRRKAKRK